MFGLGIMHTTSTFTNGESNVVTDCDGRRGNYRTDKADRILLCECDHRADEPIGLKADNSGKFITDIDRVRGREGQKYIHPRLVLRVRRVTVCREVKWELLAQCSVPHIRRACTEATTRIAAALPRRVPSCADTLPHFFGFELHIAASLRRAHSANPPRRSRDSRHPCPCHKPRG